LDHVLKLRRPVPKYIQIPSVQYVWKS
jgi:hypothetical protein